MLDFITFSLWDMALLLAISLHATGVAYLHNPRHKAAAMTLPIPFTMASLALGLHINVTHIVGMLNLLLYVYSVHWLHDKAKIKIIPAIGLSLLVYITIGMAGQYLIPKIESLFWIAAVFNLCFGLTLHTFRSKAPQQGHRTPLPLHIKLPAVLGVVTFLIIIKRLLGGFAATFPMVGTIASYELRYSLSAACHSVAMMLILVTPFQITCHVLQDSLGLGGALAAGWGAWAVMAVLFLPSYLGRRMAAAKVLDSDLAVAAHLAPEAITEPAASTLR